MSLDYDEAKEREYCEALKPFFAVAVAFCCSIAFWVVTALLLNYSVGQQPTLSLQDLYVPSLVPPPPPSPSPSPSNGTKSTSDNSTVFVDLKFERRVASTDLTVADFLITLLYDDRSPGFSVGSRVVEGFVMQKKRRVHHVKATLEAVRMPWREALRATSAGNVVPMVVKLIINPGQGVDELTLSANVVLDASGHKLSDQPIGFFRFA